MTDSEACAVEDERMGSMAKRGIAEATKVVRRPMRYAVAVVVVVLAILVTRIPGVGRALAGLLLGAVFVSAWYGGLGPGLVTSGLLTAIVTAVTYVGQDRSIHPMQLAGIVTYLIVSVLVSLMMEALDAARRRAETNRLWLRAVLLSIGDAVIATDPAGRITFINGVAEELTGWTQAEALGAPLDEVFVIVNEAQRNPAENPVRRVLETGRAQDLANHTLLIARDGRERPIADSAAPIREPGGQIGGVVLVFRDVTEKRQHERERERLNEELRKNDQRKDEFLAMLAHELRNPLAAIGQAVALATRTSDPEHVHWSLGVADRQVRHLSRLIDDLLDVSRISRGKIELRRELVEATSLLEHAVEVVRPLLDERGHRLEMTIERGRLWVHADPTRLEQVVVNLLTNAAKFSNNGGRVALSARVVSRELVIRVRDEGIGIPPNDIPAMFQLFAQGDRTLARAEGGLGIGLTVVKLLVEMHGGSVAAASEGVDCGSEFTVRLPAAAPPGVVPSAAQAPRQSPRAGQLRILIVDDNQDSAASLATLLRLVGHEVAAVHSGPEAIESARARIPDLILLDIGLPGMDGFEVASRLRREPSCRDTTIVAVSGYGQEEDRRRSREAGCDDHLVKPVDCDLLLSRLATARSPEGNGAVSRTSADPASA
jgi:PAS domain S-box-containing protein